MEMDISLEVRRAFLPGLFSDNEIFAIERFDVGELIFSPVVESEAVSGASCVR